MGNTHSDQDAYNIIKLIPVLNLAYSLPRAVVYAAKGDEKQAVHTAVSIPGNIIAAGVCFVAGPAAGAAVNTATNVFAAAAGTGYDVAARIQAQNNPGLAKE